MKKHEKQKEPAFTVMIDVFPDGKVRVRKFPENNMEQSMHILATGMIVLAKHFRMQDGAEHTKRIIALNNKQTDQLKNKTRN